MAIAIQDGEVNGQSWRVDHVILVEHVVTWDTCEAWGRTGRQDFQHRGLGHLGAIRVFVEDVDVVGLRPYASTRRVNLDIRVRVGLKKIDIGRVYRCIRKGARECDYRSSFR